MAKKKAEVQEELEEVELEEEKPAEDDGLREVPSSEIEVGEQEAEEEEVEEQEAPKKDASTDAILAGFNMLRDELRSRGEAPIAIPAKEEGENDEDFNKRVNEELFKEDPAGVLNKLVDRKARKIVETEVAPILGSIMEDAFNNAEFRLKNDEKDGPVFRKFEPEVKKLLKTLTPAQQKNPQVLKAVFDKVKSDHIDEVVEMEMERRGKKASSSAAAPAPSKNRPVVSEGGSSVLPGSSSRRVMIPKSELEEMRAEAMRMGVPVEVLVERRRK